MKTKLKSDVFILKNVAKMLITMKIFLLLILISVLNISATSTFSQNMKMSVDMQNVTVREVINEIEKQGEISFLFNDNLHELNRYVSVSHTDQPVRNILYNALDQASMMFEEVGKNFLVILPKPEHLTQQDITVTGRVTDASTGESMPGVNVFIEGTTTGTITDSEGNYSISVSDEDVVLIFSSVGFQRESIIVGGRTVINVSLEEDITLLEEVVAVGYGSMRRSDLTGSLTSINMADMPPAANIDLMQALRGAAPGLNIQGGSKAGDTPTFSIRGQTTLSASQTPLIVRDDIIFHGSISDININDVERIEILKDASAAAVYGAEAANGVILITTKSGTEAKPTVNVSVYTGYQDYTNVVPHMNAEQYVVKRLDYAWMQDLYSWYGTNPTSPEDNGGRPEPFDYSNQETVLGYLHADEHEYYLAGKETDWINEVTRIAPISDFDLSISGAGDNHNYYFSGSFTDQQGVQINDGFKRTVLTSRVEGSPVDFITVGLNASFSFRDLSGVSNVMSYANAEFVSPLVPVTDEEGNYPLYYNDEMLMRHPLRFKLVDNEHIRKNLFTTLYANIDIPGIDGLVFDFNYNNNSIMGNEKTFYPSNTFEGEGPNGTASIDNDESNSWIINNILRYEGIFADDHRVNATFVYSHEERYGESSEISASQFENELLSYRNIRFAERSNSTTNAWDETTIGLMARVNYVFRDRYLITGTIRQDGFSGFGEDNKYATFSSLSTGWVVSDEVFMDNLGWLNLLKFRLSYGENGNKGIGRYSSLSRMDIGNYVFGSSPSVGIRPSTLGNAGLGWETTTSFNLGLDFGVLNNRISGEIDLYQADTKDLLVTRSLPGATGYSDIWTNIGKVANKGVELTLNTVNTDGIFRWESKFVYAINRNQIGELYGDGRDDIGNAWFIGEPISAMYGYERAGGVWTEEEFFAGEVQENFYPGQFRLVDQNNDNRITPDDDRVIIGYGEPNYRFSIGNSLYYGNFSLTFLINSIQGGNGYYVQNNRQFLEATPSYDYANRANQPAVRENWTPFNNVDDAPAIYNYPPLLSAALQDRSFVRLQDITLLYNLPQTLLTTLNIAGLQFYVSGQNLLTFTEWEGYDPELGGSTQLMMKNIITGIRLNF